MAGVVKGAALAGDAKMALEFLKHRADWVAKQQVQVDVRQQISVLAALEQAQGRVIEGQAQDVLPSPLNFAAQVMQHGEKHPSPAQS
jgi:hypothetical protein